MDFKIAITCNVCKCGFELRPEHFKLRDRLECPNCGQELPAEFYSNLKTGVLALGGIPEFTGTDSEIFHDTGFSLRVKSYDEKLSMMGKSTD